MRRLIVVACVVLMTMLAPGTAQAAVDYTITDSDSCTAFLAAVGGTGEFDSPLCIVHNATLGAGDSLTIAGDTRLRPQSTSGSSAIAFTNYGVVNIDSDGGCCGGFYGAGVVENRGTFNFNQSFSQNWSTINNYGTIVISAELFNQSGATINNYGTIDIRSTSSISNNGSINNACGAIITGAGTITGNPPNDLCATTLSQVRGTMTYGDSIGTLTATLTRSAGPVAGARVRFTVDGVAVCGDDTGRACPLTDAAGVAELAGVPLPTGLNAGNYQNRVCARYAGDESSAPTGPTCGPLQVKRRILWVKPQDRTVGLRQPNPPTIPPVGCLAQRTPMAACWLELANGSAFVNGDDWADLNLSPLRFQYARNPPSTNASEYVGKTYRMTAFGVSSGNYEIRYQPGTLKVVAAP